MYNFLFALLIFLLASCQSRRAEEPICQSQLVTFADDDISVLFAKIQTPLTKEDVHRLDRYYPKTLEKIYKNRPLESLDVINMTRAGVSDPVILEIIKKTGSSFRLTGRDLKRLSQAGVSKRVITWMKEN